jgi:hypothetical protein
MGRRHAEVIREPFSGYSPSRNGLLDRDRWLCYFYQTLKPDE